MTVYRRRIGFLAAIAACAVLGCNNGSGSSKGSSTTSSGGSSTAGTTTNGSAGGTITGGTTTNPGGGTPTGGGSNAAGPQIPPRPAAAIAGSQFMAQTAHLTRADREALMLQEVLAGNVPSHLRTYREVTVTGNDAGGVTRVLVFRVLPDYLAIGSDSDFIRTPMWPGTGQAIADVFGGSLPTRKIVDLVWQQADHHLAPVPLTPSAQMMSNAYFVTHNDALEQQLVGIARDHLIAGLKKDVVISNLLVTKPDRVAIYGWHQTNGQPIQPLSTVHVNSYADYSHGIRLLDDQVMVDGQPMALADVLADPVLHTLLSDEGVMLSPRIP